MMAITRKLRSPLKWHGGKTYLARRIIARMPPHRVYVEPFLGGGSVLLNKPRADREVAGDIDADLIGFWSDLACHPEGLTSAASRLPYTRATFRAALDFRLHDPGGTFRRSVAYLVRNRFSRGGLGESFAWSERLRGGQPGDANAWETFLCDDLPRVVERIRGARFLARPAVETIGQFDGPDALIYCDPPYLHETRTVTDAYAHEMTADQHAELLETLVHCRGTVLVSGYPSALYDRALTGWTRHEFDMPNHAGQGKSKGRRVECLWVNRS